MRNYCRFLAILMGIFLSSCLYADKLDTAIQGELNQFYSQFRAAPAFSAIQVSVLLPRETTPRDYVAGTQSMNSDAPATTDMLTQYGSITKGFTSALILQYLHDHPSIINLQTTLLQLFPEQFKSRTWPAAWANVTLENLLNMSSGITEYPALNTFNPYDIYDMNTMVYGAAMKQMTEGCKIENGCFPTGTQYHYTNVNYILLGLILEKFYGQSYADILNQKILQTQRLQGNKIFYDLSYPNGYFSEMLNGYVGDIFSSPYLELGQNVTALNLTAPASAGAMIGNTHALANVLVDLFNNKILSADATQVFMQSSFIAETPAGQSLVHVPFSDADRVCSQIICRGLGVEYFYHPTFGPIYTHTGGTYGYSSIYMWFPKYQFIVVLTVNSTLSSVVQQAFGPAMLAITNDVISHITGQKINADIKLPVSFVMTANN